MDSFSDAAVYEESADCVTCEACERRSRELLSGFWRVDCTECACWFLRRSVHKEDAMVHLETYVKRSITEEQWERLLERAKQEGML